MKILYCRIGYMNSYNGLVNDSIKNGGSYNKDNIGHEIYNFTLYDDTYYGYVQPVKGGTINLDRITNQKEGDFLDGVLVIFVATRDKYGQVIVGWYKNARVYRKYQMLDDDVLKERDNKFSEYSIKSKKATILTLLERTMKIKGFGRSNVWYGNDEMNSKVLEYINDYETKRNREIESIDNLNSLKGYEKEIITKARINQSIFRNKLLQKYKHCLLCGIDKEELLIASHIKPWSVSNENEKLDEYNGLLLCAMHDKLFDLGLISFESDGSILISDELNKINRVYSNIDLNRKIEVNIYNIPYLKYHRENIFKDKKIF